METITIIKKRIRRTVPPDPGMRSGIIYIYDKQGVKGIFPMRNLNIKR